MPCNASVWKVECAGENPCMCASKRMSISSVHVRSEHGPQGGCRNTYGGLLRTDSLVLNLKLLPQSVACTNLIQRELTGGVKRSLHVQACMHAGRPLPGR